MKINIEKTVLFSLLLAAVFCGCNEDFWHPGEDNLIAVSRVSLNETSISLSVGGTRTLTATVTPANAKNKAVTWTSSATNTAMVSSSGLVRGVNAGLATITVTTNDGNKTAYCYVTVNAASVPVTGVFLNKTTLVLNEGVSETLTATIAPSNATNKNLTWRSNDTSIATVSTSGAVTGVAAGSTIISVTTADSNRTATCSVTIVSKWESAGVLILGNLDGVPGKGQLTYGEAAKILAMPNNGKITFTISVTVDTNDARPGYGIGGIGRDWGDNVIVFYIPNGVPLGPYVIVQDVEISSLKTILAGSQEIFINMWGGAYVIKAELFRQKN
jgi:uncharacterized protein YjdB